MHQHLCKIATIKGEFSFMYDIIHQLFWNKTCLYHNSREGSCRSSETMMHTVTCLWVLLNVGGLIDFRGSGQVLHIQPAGFGYLFRGVGACDPDKFSVLAFRKGLLPRPLGTRSTQSVRKSKWIVVLEDWVPTSCFRLRCSFSSFLGNVVQQGRKAGRHTRWGHKLGHEQITELPI